MATFHIKQREPELVRSVSYPYRVHGTRQAVVRNNRARRNFGSYFCFLFVAGVISFLFMTSAPHGSQEALGVSVQSQQEEAKPEPEPLKTFDHSAMAATIEATIAKYPRMDIGVSWIDIKTGDSGEFGVQDPFVAASTAKLLTAISFLHDVEEGSASLTQKVGTRSATAALEAMIVKSDNQSWHDFNNEVMSHVELAEYANTIGFTGYDPDNNTVTPASLAKLLANLYQRRLLNDEHTKLLLSYMERAEEVEYFQELAPAGVRVYHKPGYLQDRVHDAAIIDNGERPFVLVVFTKSRTGSYAVSSGSDVFKTIGNAAYASFELK